MLSTAQRYTVLTLAILVLALLGAVTWHTPYSLANHLQCSDGVDNDNDGRADFPQDPQCSSTEDNSESEGATASSASSSSVSSTGLNIAISDGKNTIRAGDSMIYVITLTQNTEASKVVDVDLFLSTYANVVTPDQGGTVSGNRVRWNRITLLQNQQQRLTVQSGVNPTAPEGTQLVARVTAGGAETSDTTTVQNSPQQQANFQVFVTDDRTTVAPNDTLNYRATVTNSATTSQTTDVILTTSQFITVSDLQPNAPYDSNVIVWKNVSFNAGETKTFTFKGQVRRNAQEFVSVNTQIKAGPATAADSTSVQTGARASSSRSSLSSSSSSSSRRTGAPSRSVLFSKSADTEEVVSGGSVRYTLFVQNVLLTTIDDATITDRFDASLLSVSDAGGGTVVSPGQLQWKLPRLLPGQTWEKSYTLSVSGTIAEGTQLSNVATITGNDVATASLDEKVVVAKTGIVGRLPATGAPYDVFFLLMTAPIAGALSMLQKRR